MSQKEQGSLRSEQRPSHSSAIHTKVHDATASN